MNQHEIAARIPEYEGLIGKTASMIAPFVELDADDIRQRLRIKVWRGLESYDRRRVAAEKRLDPQAMRKYVFSCVTNEKKDILKARRRGDVYIEDQVVERDGSSGLDSRFEARYLSQTSDQAFSDVGREQLELPATLTRLERRVIGLLYEGWLQTEIRIECALSVRALYAMLATIREKMADWRPSSSERVQGPTPPLPRALRAPPGAPLPATPPRSAGTHGIDPRCPSVAGALQPSTIPTAGALRR